MTQTIHETFSYLFENELLNEIEKFGKIKTFKANSLILDVGEKISHMPLLLKGAVKIAKLVLYQVQIIGVIDLLGTKITPDRLNFFYAEMKTGRIASQTRAVQGAG